uniref:B30.2/SPRY domain-containing protein n=1 Tax=Calidris pygmaea TaxID=425635 RepID=A0A8C3JHY6_9CHAR
WWVGFSSPPPPPKLYKSTNGARLRSRRPEKTKSEGKKIVCEFQQLHQFLKDQERLLLTQLADLDRAITRLQEEAVAKVSEEMSHLDTLIWEMEGKFQQPAGQFLQVRARRAKTLWGEGEETSPVSILLHQMLWFSFSPAADVTLDPSTAHPNLLLSQDGREAKGQLRQQDLPANPERFDFEPCVLGCEGFTSGRHFWEVEVGPGGVWALGVARASVKRKGALSFTPKEGVWGLEAYHSLTSPRANLRLNPLPRRIRVSLDYEGGRVAFFSPDDDVPILVYSRFILPNPPVSLSFPQGFSF